MTFYNVLSALLFLGACQAFLQALGDYTKIYMAATLAVVIFSEALCTSEFTERKTGSVNYLLRMKLLDLVIFIVLSYAVLMLTPKENIFEVDVRGKLWGSTKPWLFWLLLTVYWVLARVWADLGRIFDWKGYRCTFSRWWLYRWWLYLMPLPFLVSFVYYWYWAYESVDSVPQYSGVIPLVITVAYLVCNIWAEQPYRASTNVDSHHDG